MRARPTKCLNPKNPIKPPQPYKELFGKYGFAFEEAWGILGRDLGLRLEGLSGFGVVLYF